MPVPESAVEACLPYFGEASVTHQRRKEFGYGWRVSGGRIDITVSDYLDGAPDGVVDDLCDMICRRARGRKWSEPESLLEFVRSDGYISSRRPKYISRSRNLARTADGEFACLLDSVQRLLDSGLLSDSDIGNSYISWTRRDAVRRVGFCSTMFRVVGISSRLDADDVPDSVRDFVVYHECLHLRQGYYPPGHRSHDSLFRSWERAYPGWREAESALRKLGTGPS